MIRITNEDNMKLMARYKDKHFDLAIVDPPYGILNKTKRGGDHKFNMEEYLKWDVKPSKEFFKELIRVSKNQIVWGGNYFGHLWAESEYNRGFIVWDKMQPESLNNFSMAEMAWSSFDKPSKIFQYSVRKNRNKSHPTQKPVELYEWLLKLYAKKGDKILDTHLGSGTIAIACHNKGFDLTACEIDKNYYMKALDKLNKYEPTVKTESLKVNSANYHTKIPEVKYDKSKSQLKLFKEKRLTFKKTKV